MDKKFVNALLTVLVVLAIFALAVFLVGNVLGVSRFQTDQATILLRFAFVVLGLLIAFAVYLATRQNKAWEIGISQVALRPAIAIPMFFGYAFGPWVGFFTGAVGNMFGDALTGFGLSPQWSIANGLIGFISGLPMLFANKKKSLDTVLIIGAVLALIAAGLYFLFPQISNLNYFDPATGNFGQTQITLLAGGGAILIGLILVLIVRFVFGKNIDIAAAVTWSMLGNILGIGFAAISDIWINGYSPTAAIVGEFLPAAGPNLIFAAILVPLLVVAYMAVQKQSGR